MIFFFFFLQMGLSTEASSLVVGLLVCVSSAAISE
jgi:hypothetical protein